MDASSSLSRGAASLSTLRRMCLLHSTPNGIQKVCQAVQRADVNRSGFINAELLRFTLRQLGLCVTDADFKAIASAADTKGDGSVDIAAFAIGLRGPLNDRRKTVLDAAFRRIDANGNGVLDVDDVKLCHSTSRHPFVLSGRETGAEAQHRFMSNLFTVVSTDGKVTREEFLNYYAGVSYPMESDTEFELLLIRCWNLDHPVDKKSSSSTICDAASLTAADHPLYQTSYKKLGINLHLADVEVKHHRMGTFTKNAPPPCAGSSLNTTTTRSKVI